MTTIEPPKIANSFRDQPIDKTGLQDPTVSRPRTHQNLEDQVHATVAKAAAKPAVSVELSAQARQASAKPAVVKAEPKPAESAPAPTALAASSPTEAAKGKSVNILV